ncbi:MAG: DUF1292 domain-containing protein [Ruminococcus sp.]|nr:DUF1292 domain-containing protein [Ruminococcus sp.]
MNDNYEELDNIIVLNDEFGNEIKFEFLDLIEYNSEEYVVLYPIDEENDDGMVVILKVESLDDDSETYVSVDDENTIQAVYNIFKDKFKNQFDFEE